MIEDQPLPPLPCLEVQGAPRTDEELLRGRERFALAAAEQPGLLQRHPDRRLEQPDGVEVAPSARTLLEVGLEEVRGRAEPLGAACGVVAERPRERARVPSSPRLDPRCDVRYEVRVAREEADVHHRGAHVQAAGGRFAFLGRADRMTHVESVVPERIQQGVGEPRHRVRIGAVVEDEQVDVGPGKEQPSPVPPHGRDRRPGRRAGAREQRDDRRVHELGAPARRPHPVVPGRVRPLQRQDLGPERSDGVGRCAHRGARGRQGPSRPSGSGRAAPPR